MPVLDGLEACHAICAEETGPRLPIVAMTTLAFANDQEKCLRAGMDDYLPEPARLPELARLLVRWLPAAALQERQAAEL